MSNPFAQSGAVNPYDLPMTEQQRKAQPVGSQAMGADVVTMSADGQSVSPAGKRFLDHIVAAVRVSLDQRDKQIVATCADEFAPILKRLTALERAIDTQRKEVSDAIKQAAGQFLGETEDDGPTMEELTRRHKEHMEARRNDS